MDVSGTGHGEGGGGGGGIPPAVALAACDGGGERPEPVALAACPVDGGRVGEPVTWLVRPARPIAPVMTERVHGLGAADVARAPDLARVWAKVSGVVGGRVLVVHHAGRLLAMLGHLPDPGAAPGGVLDTLPLARWSLPGAGRGRTYALRPLLDVLGIRVPDLGGRYESARWVARATAELFVHLAGRGAGARVPFDLLADRCRVAPPPGWTPARAGAGERGPA